MADHQQVVLRVASPSAVTRARRLVLLALAAGAACAREADRPTTRREIMPGGAERVVNLPATTAGAELPWRWVEELAIAPSDSANGALMQPSHAVRTHSGHIVVADANPRALKVYDPSGRFIRVLGHQGAGPGEYRYIQLGVDVDTVVVFDPSQRRLMRFALDGTLLRTTTVESNFFSAVLDVATDGSAFIWMRDGIQRVGRDGVVRDTIRQPPEWDAGKRWWEFEVPAGPDGDARVAREPIPFVPTREVALRSDGLLLHGTTDRYEVVFSRDGIDTLRVLTSVATPIPLPDSVRERAYREARAGHGVRAFAEPMSKVVSRADIPGAHPLWSALSSDSWQRIWVTLPTSAHRRGRWDVFDSSGTYVGRAPAPKHPLPNGYWTNERFIAIDEDEDGRPVVRVWRLEERPPT